MRVLATLSLVGALAGCAAAPVEQMSSAAQAGSDQCSCTGATTSYSQVQCEIASGGAIYKPQRCYTKHLAGTNQSCGTSCEPAENVCASRVTLQCR